MVTVLKNAFKFTKVNHKTILHTKLSQNNDQTDITQYTQSILISKYNYFVLRGVKNETTKRRVL